MNPNPIGAALQAGHDFVGWFIHNPIYVLVAAAVVGGGYALTRIRGKQSGDGKDGQRLFSSSQREEAKRRAGGRCEASTFGFRCRKPGEHADHIYPHSKGGQTTMSNCQSLCAPHNLAKSAKIPSRFYMSRLVARRRRYFPAGVSPEVEWRAGKAW